MTSLVNNNLDDKILVYENEDLAAKLEKAINEYFAKSTRVLGGKVHVSSLTYCLRSEAIKSHLLKSGKKQPIDFMDIYSAMNFIRGLTSEYFLTKLMEDEIDAQKDMDYENRIQGHPDAVTKDNGAIIEMKNSNNYIAFTLDGTEGLKGIMSYLRQTVYYMIMSGIEVGHVIVIYSLPMELNHLYNSMGQSYFTGRSRKTSGKRPFDVFTLNFRKHSSLRDKIKEGMRVQHKFINAQDYSDKDVIKQFPRLDEFPDSAKCKYCSVLKECKKIEPENDNIDLVNILLNKLIDDNITVISAPTATHK